MRLTTFILFACTLAVAKPNPADFDLTVVISGTETHTESRALPNFSPTKTSTDCRINGDNATCESKTPASNANVIEVNVTRIKLRLGDILYTVSCSRCTGELQPGTYKAKWEDRRTALKVLWNDGKKDHTTYCRVVGTEAKPE